MRPPRTCCAGRRCRSRNIARLPRFLVARGFAVLVPERLGHGATGGDYLEDQGGCDEADYARSGRATADEIRTALDYVRGQPFIRKDGAVIVGHSAGGWGALALAGEDPKAIAAIVAFAPGRGGHANDFENRICAPHTLLTAASRVRQGRARARDLAGRGERHVFLAGVLEEARRCLSQRRRQGRFPCAAGIRQRRTLAAGNRERREAGRRRSRSRAEAQAAAKKR